MKQIKKVILIGNPNVGKSALFSRLTGTQVISGNFPGTTVSVTQGTLESQFIYQLIDIPGIYSLSEKSVTAKRGIQFIIDQADLVINVIDATNLKRNLYLTMQLKQLGVPTLIVLNLWDEAVYNGITLNTHALQEALNFPVQETVSVTGSGIPQLVEKLNNQSCPNQDPESNKGKIPEQTIKLARPDWNEIKQIVSRVQSVTPRKKKLFEHFATLTLHPFWGTLIALSTLGITLTTLFYMSEYAEQAIQFLFEATLTQPLLVLHKYLSFSPFLQDILVGTIEHNTINFSTSMGLLTSGLFIPLGQVAPTVTAFYIIMGILEDGGYLPRLALLSDTLMHRYALHGFAIIPMVLGAGCNVTGIVGTRVLENRQQRIITAALMSITIPCASQTGFIIAMADKMGALFTSLIFITLGLTWHILGRLLGQHDQHNYQEMIIEIPPLRRPRFWPSVKKLSYRVRNFLSDAIPITIGGIAILLVCNYFKLFEFLGERVFSFLQTLWGLPHSVIPVLFMGLFRKEVALSFLRVIPDLTAHQAFIATLLLMLWFPCISVYTILYKEFGLKTLGKLIVLMFTVSTIVGILAHTLSRTFIPV